MGSGSTEAGCGAERLPAAFGGGPEGRGPSPGGGSRPGRGAKPRPAPTAPHQVTPLILLHATTLRPSAGPNAVPARRQEGTRTLLNRHQQPAATATVHHAPEKQGRREGTHTVSINNIIQFSGLGWRW